MLVLAHGRAIYNGAGGIAPATYFADRGRPCEEGYNVADHLLDIASEPVSDTRPAGSAENEKVQAHAGPNANGHARAEAASPSIEPARADARYAATFLTQFQVLAGREWRTLRRCVCPLLCL